MLEFKNGDIKISELDKNSFFDWEQWRKKEFGAKSVTIRNEQATINQMMEFAYREGYSHFPKFEFISSSFAGRSVARMARGGVKHRRKKENARRQREQVGMAAP